MNEMKIMNLKALWRAKNGVISSLKRTIAASKRKMEKNVFRKQKRSNRIYPERFLFPFRNKFFLIVRTNTEMKFQY